MRVYFISVPDCVPRYASTQAQARECLREMLADVGLSVRKAPDDARIAELEIGYAKAQVVAALNQAVREGFEVARPPRGE
jgi:hypothetical protein